MKSGQPLAPIFHNLNHQESTPNSSYQATISKICTEALGFRQHKHTQQIVVKDIPEKSVDVAFDIRWQSSTT
jgi:hypothetical protein